MPERVIRRQSEGGFRKPNGAITTSYDVVIAGHPALERATTNGPRPLEDTPRVAKRSSLSSPFARTEQASVPLSHPFDTMRTETRPKTEAHQEIEPTPTLTEGLADKVIAGQIAPDFMARALGPSAEGKPYTTDDARMMVLVHHIAQTSKETVTVYNGSDVQLPNDFNRISILHDDEPTRLPTGIESVGTLSDDPASRQTVEVTGETPKVLEFRTADENRPDINIIVSSADGHTTIRLAEAIPSIPPSRVTA